MVRFEQQENDVPEDASRYWAKRIVPPFLFGSKHASTLFLNAFLNALVLRAHFKLTQTGLLIFLTNSFHISISFSSISDGSYSLHYEQIYDSFFIQ